ncbi:PIN domain-containing protein [Sphaerisporangium album]|uniref:PIN domain-containing protein n=1 Tax=Sphaerisporangium album TaxID=509200 RepID=UPI001FE9F685|nr:PIN domain-containing protein [Sphaerisporangium album]
MEFVDTSVLCNLLNVPGKNQDRDAVRRELQQKRAASDLILPVTTVIETGNHIAQLNNGYERRDRATQLHKLLELVIDGKAPWVLHTVEWGEGFLRRLLAGAGTGVPLTDHAMSGLGLGDLCILAERDLYRQRVANVDVLIWTLDNQLSAYS